MKRLPFKSGRVRITSIYGTRILNGRSESHYGLDMVGDECKEITAVCGGKVVRSRIITEKTDLTWQWGNYIAVQSDDGCIRYYCHLSKRSVSEGDTVKAGDVIGIEGNTGYSFGSHLHYEVRRGNVRINAADDLGIPNIVGTVNTETAEAVSYMEKIADAVGFDDKPAAVEAMKTLKHGYPRDFWRKIFEKLKKK